MRKVSMDPAELKVDSFPTNQDNAYLLPYTYHDTVLRNTEALSCGGTCGTCGGTDCWA
jgi:hypothetical protein